MTPRLQTSGDGQMEQPSTSKRRSPTFWSSVLEATTIGPVVLLLSLRRQDDIQVFMLCRQLTMASGGAVWMV